MACRVPHRDAAQSSVPKGLIGGALAPNSELVGDSATLFRIAAKQHGVFNLAQARKAGYNRSAVHHRLANGTWIRVDDSVYALASAPRTLEQTLWACVSSRGRAVLTHWTACRLFGLSDAPAHIPVILVPRGSNTRSGLAQVFETDQFERIARTHAAGLPVTTMPETILLLARDTDAATVTRVFDEALIGGKLDLKAMSATIDREAGRRTPGTPLLRRLTSSRLPGAPAHSSSYLERLLEVVLRDPRLPEWTREYEFSMDGVPSRVDFFVSSSRVVIEADGRNWHTKGEDFERDRRRDNALAARGIQVIRFTHDMLTTEPQKCLDQAVATCLIRAA